jgi:hypothetical protein
MSLAVLADHMASKGRGPDSMLIHMSPREVQGLQSLAMKHGGSLTINPETGLPEAGFLDKLLPAILGFALAPMTAGTSLAFLGATPMASALTVGGLQALRTGDIGKGISAGLGAYGGAGLQAGLATAGTSAIGGEAAKAASGLTGDMAFNLADAGSSLSNTLAGGETGILSSSALSDEAIKGIQQQAAADKIAAATPFDRISAGAKAAAANPSSLLTKDNFKYLAAGAAPILADQAVKSNLPTTTTKPGMIRPYSFDPYGGTYTAGIPYEAAPAKAADGGLMGMNDGGYSPGQLNFAQRSEPVVRMAEGGIAGYAPGGYVPTDKEIFDYFKTPGLSDAKIAQDMQTFGVSAADIARATGTQDKQANYEQRFVQTLNAPTTDASDFQKATQAVGLKDQALATAMQNAGYSQGAQYALTQPALSDAGFTGGIIDSGTGKAVDLYNQIGYTAGALPGDKGGLEGLYGNINYVSTGLQNLIDTGKMSVADAQNAALAELARTGVSVADVKAATGKDFGNLFKPKEEKKVVTPITPITTVTGTTIIPGVNDYGLGGTGTSGRLESIYGPSLPPGVSGAGITTVNPNGTITTRPDLSLQMKDVRDVYEKGGGSLGVNKNLFVPKTQDELFARYKNTGGSKAALDYLMGKTPYSPTPYTPTGEIQKPYWESVGRFPENRSTKKYVFVDGKYQLNPDYVKPSYVLAGEKAAALTNQDKEPTESPGAGNKWTWNSTDKKWEAKPISAIADTSNQLDSSSTGGEANGGLMAMAGGGMAGQFDLGGYSDGGRLLRGPGDGVSDSIPATIGNKRPARLADGEFVVPARIVSELGNGSTEAGARKLYAMMDRVQKARRGTVGKGKVAKNSRSDKYLPA